MKHIHHIIPRHMGGTDDPSNLIELTIQEHAEAGHMTKIQKMGNLTENGSKGGKATIESGKGSFGNPAERLRSASKGGKTQGKRNAENGHLKRIALLPNKRSSGKMWITNGKINMMIFPNEPLPDGFQKGKIQKKNV